jgi:hypothetical protein
MVSHARRANLPIRMVMSTRVVGPMGAGLARAHRLSQVSLTRACGKVDSSMALAMRCSVMPTTEPSQANTGDFSNTARKTERASISGRTALPIRVSGKPTRFMERERTRGLMGASMSANGSQAGCMGLEFTRGPTKSPTKANISRIRSMDMVGTRGLMDESTRGTGRKASNMDLESTQSFKAGFLKSRCGTGFGLRALANAGLPLLLAPICSSSLMPLKKVCS